MTKTVIVTTTFYKSVNELRFKLACQMVEKAVEAGHVVVIVDASPIPEVSDAFKKLGAKVFPQLHKGMGPGRREAFFHATELAESNKIDEIVWTEPEKVDLIRFIDQIVASVDPLESPIVIPKRSEVAWATWPAFQRESEKKANTVYNEAFGGDGFDPMFGPVAFHVYAAEAFVILARGFGDNQEVPDAYIQHYAPILWQSEQLLDSKSKVLSVEIDMQYPPEQRAEEEGSANDAMLEKRKTQLDTLTGAYRALARVHGKVYEK